MSPIPPPLAPEDWDETLAQIRERLETFEPDPAVRPLNAFGRWAHHPDLLRRWMVFSNHLMFKSGLSRRDCEIVILRSAWRTGSDYEWGHHRIIGRGVGLSEAEIGCTALEDPGDALPADDLLVVQAVDDVHRTGQVSAETLAALSDRYDTKQLLDLVFLIGHYHMVSVAIHTFGVEREPGVPGFPD